MTPEAIALLIRGIDRNRARSRREVICDMRAAFADADACDAYLDRLDR